MHPEVAAANHRAMKPLVNATAVAGFFAFIGGLAATVLPWGFTYRAGPDFTGGVASGNLSIAGSNLPHGGAIGVTFLLLLLYLIATGPLQPSPVWRSVGTVIFSLIAGIIFLLYGYGPGGYWTNFSGPWITILSILALLIIATVELRGAFARKMPAVKGEAS
jgi:hypothetical protein